MALTPRQIQLLEEAKKQGLTREQAMAKVFVPVVEPKDTGRFAGTGADLAAAGKGVWSDFRGRAANIREGFAAGARGEQTQIETGAQMAGNILGGAGDIAFRGLQAVATPFLKETEEEAIATGVSNVVQATGIPEAVSKLSPRTQRNITGGLGLLEGATAGTPGFLKRFFSRSTPSATPSVTSPAPTTISAPRTTTPSAIPTQGAPVVTKTTEQIGQDYVNRLRTQANDPNLTPRAKEEAAQASLTFKEKWVGLRPDEKKRLQEMGEGKITEYLDATHLRNISDTPTPDSPLPPNVWGPQELGNYYVTQAFDKLNGVLTETGSEIGRTRAKLATVRLQQPQIDVISSAFDTQLKNLGLGVKNGQIVELPNKISKTTGSDINAIQSLYNDFLKFKQSPTIENAYALRTNFDAKIKFGQSARDVSNAVDPLSRSVRSTIADEAAKVIGKENAGELKKYSDFMDAYGDLKSYTDRSAGSEYLLRLILSGRGREARDLVDTIKVHTGIDLMNDATAMKIAVERFANESQQNLFKQEVTRAGYDIAGLFQSGPVGIIGTVAQRLAEYGIDAEDVIKATAAGAAGYVLMTYYGEDGLAPAGIAVLAAMPDSARRQAIKQAQDIAKSTGRKADDLAKYENGVPESDLDRVFRRQEEEIWKDRGMETTGDGRLREASFNQGATPQTTALLEEARKFVANSKVKTPLYHAGPKGITEFKTGSSGGAATFGEGVYLTPSKETASIYSNQGKNKIYEVYADIRNPLDIEKVDEETWFQFIQQSTPEKKRAWLEKKGYDAVIDLEEGGNNEIMVLRPEQLKIANPGKPTAPTALLEEAKKYKSAEEFVRAQGLQLIRGSGSSQAGNVDLYGKGLYLTDDINVAKNYGNTITEHVVSGKIFDATKPLSKKDFTDIVDGLENVLGVSLKEYRGAWDDTIKISHIINEIDSVAPTNVFENWAKNNNIYNSYNPSSNVANAINEALKKKGVVGIKYSTDEIDDLFDNNLGGRNAYVIFGENVPTRTQLEDIWKQASK